MSSAVVVVSPEDLRALIRAEVRAALEDRREPAPPAEWLDARACASLLGVHVRTVHRLARAGELPSTTVGNALRIRRADVDAYLARGA